MNETVNQEMNEVSAKEPRTFTQEEVDHLIGERLFREREKYAGFGWIILHFQPLLQELIHARTVFQDPDIPIQITNKYKPLNEAITEVAARGICKAEGVQVLNLSYPKYVRRFRNIASIMGVDELKLSLSLIDMPYERRYDWIKQMLDMLNSNNEITISLNYSRG